jgi:hypothetical protein
MIKFGQSLVEHERCLIEFERKRLILYLSKLNNLKLWINIRHENQNIIISGIVESIINGAVEKNKHFLLGGEFSLNNENCYLINDIYAVSFIPFSFEDEYFKRAWADSFNSSIYGNESELTSNILFSGTDLKPQDFNNKTPSDQAAQLTCEFRKFNTRYYEIIAEFIKNEI